MEETPKEQPAFEAPATEAPATDGPAAEAPVPPPKARGLGRGRLFVGMAVTVAVVAGGAAFALAGGEDDGGEGSDGVASVDSGDSESDGEEESGSGDEKSMEEAALEYAECMREHGVDMPDPVIEGGRVGISVEGGDPAEMEEAEKACKPIMDAAGPDESEKPSPEEIAKRQDEALALAECMRGRGYDFPDPEVGEDGGIQINGGGPSPGDEGSEEFEQDMQECHEEAGMEAPGSGEGGLDSETET